MTELRHKPVAVALALCALQGAAAEDFVFGPIALDGVERIRIRARESGVVGSPGTLQITGEVQP